VGAEFDNGSASGLGKDEEITDFSCVSGIFNDGESSPVAVAVAAMTLKNGSK
jgi:hypothetical protein